MKVYIGTSGWIYEDWWGIFYPGDLPHSQTLEYYAKFFNSVEINATFYRFFKDSAFRGWGKKAPEGFTYTLKMPRLITHLKKLQGVENSLMRFLQQARLLGNRLGSILIQLPPNLKKDIRRLEEFLHLLPSDFLFAFEFRHTSWFSDDVYEMLNRYGMGFVSFHHPYMNTPKEATGKIVYLRFHGSLGLYYGRYSREELRDWAKWAKKKAKGKEAIFVYFNNDVNGDAVFDAIEMKTFFAPRKKNSS
ncbi:MAG: DUF72 domain-containing protein [bacterium]